MKPQKIRLLFTILISSIFWVTSLFGQLSEPTIRFSTLGPENKLSQSSVSHIIQDDQGIMWIATQVGIDRYDGRDFEPVSNLNKALVESFTFLKDSDFGILVGINKRLLWIDKMEFDAENDNKEIKFIGDSVKSNLVNVFPLKEDPSYDYLLFTEKKVFKFNGEVRKLVSLDIIPDTMEITKVLSIGINQFLIGTTKGLYELAINDSPALKEIVANKKITALHFNEKDSLVFAGSNQLDLLVYNPINHKKLDNNLDSILSKIVEFNPTTISSIYVDQDNILWVGTQKSGLYLFDINYIGNDAIRFDGKIECHAYCPDHQEINSNKITCITASRDGVVWVGTKVGGVNYWQKHKQDFDHLFKREFIGKNKTGEIDSLRTHDNHVLGLLSIDSEKLLIGSNEGLILLDTRNPNSFKKILPDSEKDGAQIISCIVQPNVSSNEIILGTNDGLYRINKNNLEKTNTYKKIHSTAGDTSISILYFHKSKEEWWISNRGKSSITVLNKNFSPKNILLFPNDEMISFFQELTVEGVSGVLVATVKSMYWYGDDQSERKKFNTYNMHVLCATSITKNDELWLGTDRKGIFKYHVTQEKYTDSITIEDNFIPDVIYGILPDRFRNLWISTNHGLFQVCPKNRLVNHYRESDLEQVGEFNSGSFCTDQDSSIFYFGGIDGVTAFTPKDIVDTSMVDRPSLMVSFDYPELVKKNLVYSKLSKDTTIKIPRIPSHFNYLDIEFTLPNYHDPLNNQFRVVLDQDTLFATDGKLNLTEGDFKRKVFKCNLLKVDYRSGNGAWTEGGVFKINRGILTIEQLLLVLIAFVGYLTSFIIRRYNTNNLIRIQRRINKVSRSETIDELKKTVKGHLINDFDYVIISLVDFNQKRIVSVDSACKNKSIADPKEWIENSNYSLDADDILSQIVTKKISTVVLKNEILNSAIKKEGALNLEISKKYKHDQLARLFVPIIHKAKKHGPNIDNTSLGENNKIIPEEEDLVMGVIEVGFIPKAYEGIYSIIRKFIQWAFPENGYIARFLSPLEYLRHKEVQLKIYADNFAQPYYRAVLKANRQNFYEEVLDPYEEQETKHFEYIRLVLEKVADKIGAEYGNIAFRSFNNDGINMTDRRNVFYGQNYDQNTIKSIADKFKDFNKGKKGLTNHVARIKAPYYCNDIFTDKYYVKLKEDVLSEAAFPMMDRYKVVYGVFIVSSTKANFFNDVLVETIKKVVDKATDSFLKKVESNTLTQLMTPLDIFSRSNDVIYQNAVETLKQYFYADYIGVWKRFREDDKRERAYSEEQKNNKFILSDVTTNDLWKLFEKEKYKIAELTDKVIKENITEPIQIQEVAKYMNREARIVKICDTLDFKSYVVISIIIDGRIEAFFNVFSKRKIDENELSQYSREFLDSFSNKINMALQHAELINAFTDISESLSNQEVETPLEVIVEEAYDLLPSTNSVVLFPYRGKEITLEEVYAAGGLPKADLNDKKKRANVANYVIDHGTQWISSEEENNKIILASKTTGPNRVTFWKKNNIKSSAAVLLKYGTRPIGVMFFNYNKKKDFEEQNAKRIILAFTNLAATALINEDFISRIKEETSIFAEQNSILRELKIGIEEDKKRVEKDKRKVEKENEELEMKNMKLLPKAGTASYFLILQGVNHDIRNFLIGMQNELDEVVNMVPAKDQETVKSNIDQIDSHVDLINNLLELFDFRDEVDKIEINVNQIISDVLKFFRNRDRSVNFKIDFQKDIPTLLCMKTEFSMIIYNLIDNAIRATGRKGVITIKTKYKKNNYLFHIEDDGIGIDKTLKNEIFKLGYTTKFGGKGIGLFFVKETVEKKMKGSLEVDSYKNKGTKILITIPGYINKKQS